LKRKLRLTIFTNKNSDIDVSVICLGTMTFGVQNTEEEAHEQLNYAFEKGVNFIDTAEMYPVPPSMDTTGRTERYIGSWLKGRKDRDKIYIATKATGPSSTFHYLKRELKFDKENLEKALELSLKQLQTDYIDLYQLHWPERINNRFGVRNYKHTPNEPWKENFESVISILEDFKKQGKIRHFGLSNETPWGMMKFAAASEKLNASKMVSIQNPYNLLNRSFEIGCSEVAIREKIGLLAYSPLAFGVLSGKFLLGTDVPRDRVNRFPQYSRYSSENCTKAVKKYFDIAEKNDTTLTKLNLQFINKRDFLTSTIIGATQMDQLKENIGSVNLNLTD